MGSSEDSSWVGIVFLLVLLCCCCACCIIVRAISRRTCNRQVHPRGQQAHQNFAMPQQHMGGPIHYQNQNIRIVTAQEVKQHPPVFMPQQGQISSNQPQPYQVSFVQPQQQSPIMQQQSPIMQQQSPILQQQMFIPLVQQQQQQPVLVGENLNRGAYTQT